MPTPETGPGQHRDDPPPTLFKSWGQIYAFVLILHAAIITLFYIFTKTYS